jgi:hypothetical protein
VTDAQKQKINQLADAMEAAAKKQRETQEAFKSFNGLLSMGGNITMDFIDKLGDKTSKLSDVVVSAVSMLKRAALQAAILGEENVAYLRLWSWAETRIVFPVALSRKKRSWAFVTALKP